MKRIPVESSSIKSIGYDISAQKLEVEFMSDKIYVYYHVENSIVLRMLFDKSIGKFFKDWIAERYQFEKVL